jgi:hypothetical protein
MAVLAYRAVYVLTWLLSLAFIAFCAYFIQDRAPHLNQFGHLTLSTELILFGLPLAAMASGLLQLALRDRAYPRS